MSQLLDLTNDELLTTTRAVRKRLDFERPVDMKLIDECLEIAVQAPSASNTQTWHFVVVTDDEKRRVLGDLYRKAAEQFYVSRMDENAEETPLARSALYLFENLAKAPVHVIPCIEGRLDGAPALQQAGMWGTIAPATWNFCLAARARGLGTVWTSLHLVYEREAADLLGIPYDEVMQTALIPVAHTIGTDFKPAARRPMEEVVHRERW